MALRRQAALAADVHQLLARGVEIRADQPAVHAAPIGGVGRDQEAGAVDAQQHGDENQDRDELIGGQRQLHLICAGSKKSWLKE